jgi:hypothetical protein
MSQKIVISDFQFYYQYTAGLVLPAYISWLAYQFYISHNAFYVHRLLYILFSHITFDLVVFYNTISLDYKIHHTITLFYGVSSYYSFTYFPPYMSCVCISAEVSTFFLTLKAWLPKNHWIYDLNNFIFVVTFFATRIFGMFYYVIGNGELYELRLIMPAHIYYSSLLSVYMMTLLNLYWGALIARIMYKKIWVGKPARPCVDGHIE